MAYRQFLKSNGISHDNVEEAEYCHVLESQKIVGQDLDLLADSSNTRHVSIGIFVGLIVLFKLDFLLEMRSSRLLTVRKKNHRLFYDSLPQIVFVPCQVFSCYANATYMKLDVALGRKL